MNKILEEISRRILFNEEEYGHKPSRIVLNESEWDAFHLAMVEHCKLDGPFRAIIREPTFHGVGIAWSGKE
jgi:hypothetical protein